MAARQPPAGGRTSWQVLRFLVVGGANTLVTAAAFYALAAVLPARVAFTLVYVAGVVFVVLVTPGFVFGASAGRQARLLLALWYVVTYLVGLGVVTLLTSAVSAPRIVVVLVTVSVTAPMGFLGARLIVAGAGSPGRGAPLPDSPAGSGSTRGRPASTGPRGS